MHKDVAQKDTTQHFAAGVIELSVNVLMLNVSRLNLILI
jgi:hypothetical protein